MEFVYDKDNVDPVLDIQFLSEAYYKADDDYTEETTVPALIDLKTGKVVNNDYHRLTNYFEVDFKPFHKKNAPDLYPEELRKDIDEMNDWLFDNINNGVYKTTFCRSKEAYWDCIQFLLRSNGSVGRKTGEPEILIRRLCNRQ